MFLAVLGWFGEMLRTCWQASATLPLLVALGLAAGRRGNGQFSLWGAKMLSRLGLVMAVCGVMYFPYDYLAQIYALNGFEGNIWQPFTAPAGLPWSTSLLVQIAGLIFLAYAGALLSAFRWDADTYSLRSIRGIIFFDLLAALCFLGTFFLINWPFAGLPQGLAMDRAIFAVMRNAAHHYFMAFTPAGAFALAIYLKNKRILQDNSVISSAAARWLAFWACAGSIPAVGQNWAILIGLGFRGNMAGYFPGGISWHIITLAIWTAALFLWFIQALLKRKLKGLAMLALFFYLLQASVPYIRQIG